MIEDAMSTLLLIKTGDTLEPIKQTTGDFDRMFVHHLGGLANGIAVIEAHKGEELPSLREAGKVIITGSPHSVVHRETWADRLAAWIAEAVRADVPILGVCYGHQLLAHAIGGRVEVNPNGYEVGTIDVQLTEEGARDPLLGSVSGGRRVLEAHSTHRDSVILLPPGARILATTAKTPVQAFRVGARAWGVQFHPEFTSDIMRRYIEGRANVIEKEAKERGEDPGLAKKRAEDSVRDTPSGTELLRAFVERSF
jgi:GMP synthase (glutamine-hydrolysing)